MNTRIVARPSKPESSEDHHWSSNHGALQAILRRRRPLPLFNQSSVLPRLVDSDSTAENNADADANEGESALRNCEVAFHTEDDRDRFKHCESESVATDLDVIANGLTAIQNTVDDGDVDSD